MVVTGLAILPPNRVPYFARSSAAYPAGCRRWLAKDGGHADPTTPAHMRANLADFNTPPFSQDTGDGHVRHRSHDQKNLIGQLNERMDFPPDAEAPDNVPSSGHWRRDGQPRGPRPGTPRESQQQVHSRARFNDCRVGHVDAVVGGGGPMRSTAAQRRLPLTLRARRGRSELQIRTATVRSCFEGACTAAAACRGR